MDGTAVGDVGVDAVMKSQNIVAWLVVEIKDHQKSWRAQCGGIERMKPFGHN